jgi:hypothetical protein
LSDTVGHGRADQEFERVSWWSAALLLCGFAHEAGSETTTFSIDGVSVEDGKTPIGDWEIVVRRKVKPV